LNPGVAESIKTELESLERMGRVTAQDHRPVHAEFGFEGVQPDPAEDPVALVGGINVATDLDDAWSRLKRSINPE
jgi:exonuclease III